MRRIGLIVIAAVLTLAVLCPAENNNGIDPDAIIERIVTLEKRQMENIKYISYDAEYVEGENNDEGVFKEKVRFTKNVFVKYQPDTALMHEEYLEYYKDGKLQEEKKLKGEAKDRTEKKKKRKAKDISFSMLEPFYPENRELYDISYNGITEDKIENYTCYHFKVNAKDASDSLINGDFYFDTETFNPVKVDFAPAKLTKKFMFKLKEMSMSVTYGPSGVGDLWLPVRFDIAGKGKAMFFIGVKFSGTEYYRNPVVNDSTVEKYFEVNDGN